MPLIDSPQGVQLKLLPIGRDARLDVGKRLRAWNDQRTLMGSGEKITGEDLRTCVGLLRRDHDKASKLRFSEPKP
jgi:hypothetical protein